MVNFVNLHAISPNQLIEELGDLLNAVTNENCVLFCKNGRGWQKEISSGSRHDVQSLINILKRKKDQRLGVCITQTSAGFNFVPYNFRLS